MLTGSVILFLSNCFSFDVSITKTNSPPSSEELIGTIDSINGAVYTVVIQKDKDGNVSNTIFSPVLIKGS